MKGVNKGQRQQINKTLSCVAPLTSIAARAMETRGGFTFQFCDEDERGKVNRWGTRFKEGYLSYMEDLEYEVDMEEYEENHE